MKERYGEDSVFTVKSQKGYMTKKALLDAGIGLIADLGIYGFSISDLCKKAGRKRTAFYAYFDSLEQYFDELSHRENAAFETDFEKLHGQAYTEMTPGLKRMVLTLLQFFAIAKSRAVWNRFVVKLFSQHAPTAATMYEDIKADVVQGIQAGDFQIRPEDSVTFAQLVLASLSISFQSLDLEETPDPDGHKLIEMLMDAGKVADKGVLRRSIEAVSHD